MEFNKAVGEMSRFLERKNSYLFFVGITSDAHQSLSSHGVDLSDMRKFRIVNCESSDTAVRVVRYFRDNFQLQGQEQEERENLTQVYIFELTPNTNPSL